VADGTRCRHLINLKDPAAIHRVEQLHARVEVGAGPELALGGGAELPAVGAGSDLLRSLA